MSPSYPLFPEVMLLTRFHIYLTLHLASPLLFFCFPFRWQHQLVFRHFSGRCVTVYPITQVGGWWILGRVSVGLLAPSLPLGGSAGLRLAWADLLAMWRPGGFILAAGRSPPFLACFCPCASPTVLTGSVAFLHFSFVVLVPNRARRAVFFLSWQGGLMGFFLRFPSPGRHTG